MSYATPQGSPDPIGPGSTDTTTRRPDARDPRRVWAKLLPRISTFKNRRARELAEWADAFLHDDTWEAWIAAHPDAVDGPAEVRR